MKIVKEDVKSELSICNDKPCVYHGNVKTEWNIYNYEPCVYHGNVKAETSIYNRKHCYYKKYDNLIFNTELINKQ